MLSALIMLYLNWNQPSHPDGPSPRNSGWLYIAYDCQHLMRTKIGMTTRPIFDRIRESTTNPFYVLFAAFHIPENLHHELKAIENYVARKLHAPFINHPSGSESEWCILSPSDALAMIVGKLPNTGCVDGSHEGFDFTRIIYLPKINPYKGNLCSKQLDDWIQLAAPEIYIQELESRQRQWDVSQDFLQRVSSGDGGRQFFLAGPRILIERINYDLAKRPSNF